MRKHKLAAALLCALLMVIPASAHGGHCGRQQARQSAPRPACTVSGCALASQHTHSTASCGAVHVNGVCDGSCGRHALCTVEGCTVAGLHIHNGTEYCGAAHAGGYCDGSCLTRPLCNVDGCTTAGPHTHDGTEYCGAANGRGYNSTTATQVRGGGHHHGHH